MKTGSKQDKISAPFEAENGFRTTNFCIFIRLIILPPFFLFMQAPQLFNIRDQHFWLSHHRCVYWEEQKALIIADSHFGKTGHFRKSGIGVPQSVFREDMHRLVHQIQFFNASTLIVVGDMFHSEANKELDFFIRWRQDQPELRVKLVVGNHDILQDAWYLDAGIEILRGIWEWEGICFVHDYDPLLTKDDRFYFSGHIHPGIRISGAARQSLSFPCFYFTPQFAVLPAFGKFTGFVNVYPKEGEMVFAIVNNKLLSLS